MTKEFIVDPIRRCVVQLSRLPGIGEKTAQRLTWWLLQAPDDVVAELAAAVGELRASTERFITGPRRRVEVAEFSICTDEELRVGDFAMTIESGELIDAATGRATLNWLFRGGPDPSCLDAADANDDGQVDVSDPLFTLFFLFLEGEEPPPPGPVVPGLDPTPDELDCSG